uniref:Uncharacterized protein n=1 Tax=Emiliania huxleyi TaxID=2903 RepID=A0A6V2T2G4_EMIHU
MHFMLHFYASTHDLSGKKKNARWPLRPARPPATAAAAGRYALSQHTHQRPPPDGASSGGMAAEQTTARCLVAPPPLARRPTRTRAGTARMSAALPRTPPDGVPASTVTGGVERRCAWSAQT